MSTTTTVHDLANSFTLSAYTISQVNVAVEASYNYCSAKIGELITLASGTVTPAATLGQAQIDDLQQASAIAMLAASVLNEGARHKKLKRQGVDIVPRSIDKLFTSEMEQMLLIGDEQNPQEWDFSNEQPVDHWDVTT